MILNTFAKPGDKHVIAADYKQTILLNKLVLTVELDPSCWVGNNVLGILVRGENVVGSRYLSKKLFSDATTADLTHLIKKLKLVKCTQAGCKGYYLKNDEPLTLNIHKLCAKHFHAQLKIRTDAEEARLKAAEELLDDKKRSAGYRYKAIIWIHPKSGDDYFLRLYFKDKPTKKALKDKALSKSSTIIDDFSISKL